jgi:hypothetical protein
MGDVKINNNKKYFLLLNFLKIPIKLIKPENCKKLPNCSAPKKKPREYNASPEPTNKLVKLSTDEGNFPV